MGWAVGGRGSQAVSGERPVNWLRGSEAVVMAKKKQLPATRGGKAPILKLSEAKVALGKCETVEEVAEVNAQAELALAQAIRKLEAQQIVDRADRKKRNLEEAQKQRDLDKAKKDLKSLSVFAESPGLVVYEKIWNGSRPEKIRVGDEPWGGATLVT